MAIGATGFRSGINDTIILSANLKTLVGALGTIYVPVFRITGVLRILRLWGIVSTQIGANHTAASFRLNDAGGAPKQISLLAGPDLSGKVAGTCINRKGLVTLALAVCDAAACGFTDPVYEGSTADTEFIVQQKFGVNTDIEYVYTTTDNPTTGAIQFYCEYQPRNVDGSIAVI
ncbi:MAG: hypothetical protein WC683_02335 [bacterium]